MSPDHQTDSVHVVTRAALQLLAACHIPLGTGIAAAVNAHPHTALPFVVEHAGGMNKEGMQFFRMCRDAADNKLNARASDQPGPVLLVQPWVL